ncbi:glycosyltransferase [archaeon]|jgi:glycosyltransferase involved in cell wall biosynthesis|nr:glycosyltransferase [archaeon]MBT6698062.1 glycosyltransferase [archaeon]
MEWLFWISFIVGVLFLVIPVLNFFTLHRLQKISLKDLKKIFDRSQGSAGNFGDLYLPKVSLMIPMRNEAHNLIKTLPKFLSQDYPNLEIILIDDHSDDNTYKVCKKLIKEYNAESKAKVVSGKTLPRGWMGKSWALWQTSKLASGELYLFFDADVYVDKGAVRSLVYEMKNRSLCMLSCFPKQIMKSIGEKLTVPIISWGVFAFMPVILIGSKKWKKTAVANGQCILIKRSCYDKIGGHKAIRHEIVDDVSMARMVKKVNFDYGICFGEKLVSCRMYHDFKSGALGFIKSIFRGAKMHPLLYAASFTIVFGIYIVGFFGMFIWSWILPLGIALLLQRTIISVTSRENLFWSILLFPLVLIVFPSLALISFVKSHFGSVEWKGRAYVLGDDSISVRWDLSVLRSKLNISSELARKLGSWKLRKHLLSRMHEVQEKASQVSESVSEYVHEAKEAALVKFSSAKNGAKQKAKNATKKAKRKVASMKSSFKRRD